MKVPSFAQISQEVLDAEHSPTSDITFDLYFDQNLPFLLLRLVMYSFSKDMRECLDLGLSADTLQDVKACLLLRKKIKGPVTMTVFAFSGPLGNPFLCVCVYFLLCSLIC